MSFGHLTTGERPTGFLARTSGTEAAICRSCDRIDLDPLPLFADTLRIVPGLGTISARGSRDWKPPPGRYGPRLLLWSMSATRNGPVAHALLD